MKSPIGSPTKAHVARFQRIQESGCLACYLDGRPGEPCDIHHLLSGGRRIGHGATVGLCPWHHRGIDTSMSCEDAQEIKGPSYAREPRKFKARYGSDTELLRLQEELLS